MSGDLRTDLAAALREESLNLGCAGIPELDRLADLCDRLATRIERQEPIDALAECPAAYQGVAVPATLQPNWDQPEAAWWRAGVTCAQEAAKRNDDQ